MLLVRAFRKSWWGRSLLFDIYKFVVIFIKMFTMSKMAAISYLKMVLWFYQLFGTSNSVCFCFHFDTLLFFPKSFSCFFSKVVLCVWYHVLVQRTVACKCIGQNRFKVLILRCDSIYVCQLVRKMMKLLIKNEGFIWNSYQHWISIYFLFFK